LDDEDAIMRLATSRRNAWLCRGLTGVAFAAPLALAPALPVTVYPDGDRVKSRAKPASDARLASVTQQPMAVQPAVPSPLPPEER
jgi:hypothetical protein